MEKVQVTFAIPYYKNERLLKKTIESVFAQTVANWRLVISLDSPLSADFLRYLSEVDNSRIELTNNESKGISGNWNNCIASSTTEYTTILHSDDELNQDYLSVILNLIKEKSDCALYFTGADIIDINSNKRFSFVDSVKGIIRPNHGKIQVAGDKGLASLLKGCYIFCPSICYKTDIIKKYQFMPQWQMVLDLELYSRLLFNGYAFYGSNEKAYRYRRHANNQTAKLTKDFQRFDEEVRIYSAISKQAKKDNWSITEMVAENKRIIKLHLLFLFCKSMARMRLRSAVTIIKYYYRIFW
ncbi:glycosyltransferase [Colwellia sp. RSH04]|uniref:glycosyltransferase n=1 Tax=Colwellia sp. RSH04 TaxID=2305464 RepID=UPI000E593257|nr:glycosyltransferase [Colwellia sp. RSH04]RHW74896.1 glycosyltransferase [Colwellia sp. RSH04]